MHNYWSTWRVSCDWKCHIARKSAGGTDYAVPVGTPIQASFDGKLEYKYSSTTNLARAILTRPRGVAFYHLHLSKFGDGTQKARIVGNVEQGDVIGYTGGRVGAWGSGTANGPHLHANAIDADGKFRDVHDYFTTTVDTSSSQLGDNMATLDADDLKAIAAQLDLTGAYIVKQLAGTGEYADDPLTLKQIRNDIGYRDSALAKIQASIGAIAIDADGNVDVQPILDAIHAQPALAAAATIAGLKAAL